MQLAVSHRLLDRLDVRAVQELVRARLAPLYDAPDRPAWQTVKERSRWIGKQERPADVGYRTMRPTGYLQYCLVNDERPYSPWALPLPGELAEELRPFEVAVNELCRRHYGEGTLHFCVFAVLAPSGSVPTHRDLAHDPEKKRWSHHLHVPLLHAEGAAFTIGDETFRMEEGLVYEIDNTLRHSTLNHGDRYRVNLMLDYRPGDAVAPDATPRH